MPSCSRIKNSQLSVHEDLHNQLKRSREIEKLPQRTHFSSEEKRCEETSSLLILTLQTDNMLCGVQNEALSHCRLVEIVRSHNVSSEDRLKT